MTGRPLRWVPRGRQPALGVVVDPRLLGERRARERVLALLAPGARVYRTEAGLVVRWVEARELREPYPGAPLLPLGRVVSTAPLDRDEQRSAPELSAARAGELAPLDLSAPEDPSRWLLLDLPVLEGRPLGAEPPPARAALVAVSVGAGDLGVDGLVPERDTLAALLAAGARRSPSLVERGLLGLAGLLSMLRGRGGEDGAAADAPDPRPNPLQRALLGLEGWLGGMADRIGLSAMLGARYQRYVDDLLARFASGDLLEALRRAIPLGGEGANGAPGLPFGGLPLRGDLGLSFTGRTAGAGRSVGAGPSLYDLLRKLYLSAAERLERDGRYEQAAFVHDELLRDAGAAVALLERHGLLDVAARLAEVRKLPPGLIVRLWWLAGERQRALLVARRDGAFVDALVRLKDDPEAATALRRTWAESLARQGRWLAAIDAAGEVPELQSAVRGWMDRAIAEGGPVGASLVPRRLVGSPDELERLAEVVARWAGAEEPAALDALLVTLAGCDPAPVLTALTRHAARLAAAAERIPARTLTAAAQRHAVGPIADDLPHEPLPIGARRVVDPGELGAAPILDATRAMDGSWLVALGEAGVLWLDPTGRTCGRFEWPTTALVPCGDRNRFVLVGDGAGYRRLARLDLGARAVRPWAEAPITRFARESDGDVWLIAAWDEVLAIDLLDEQWQFLWSARECGGPVMALAVTPAGVHALLGAPVSQTWRWERPGYVLRERRNVTQPVHLLWDHVALDPSGAPIGWGFELEGRGRAWRHGDRYTTDEDLVDAWPHGSEVARLIAREVGLELRAGSDVVELRGATAGGVRASEAGVWAFDDLGRLVFVDRHHRVRVVRVTP